MNEKFAVIAVLPGQNSWRPQMQGTLTPVHGGTLVDLTLAVSTFIAVFTLIHGIFLPLFAWVLRITAFSFSVPKSLAALQVSTGGELNGATIGDPLAQNAELQAPWSLQPQIEVFRVRFTIYGQRTLLGLERKVTLVVSPAGLQLEKKGDATPLTWHAVASMERIEQVLHFGEHVLDCSGHAVAHVQWLRAYLHAQAQRYAATDAEKDAVQENARRLRAIQSVEPPPS